jgi:transcriptional regulator with XRE-family HTH domain
MELRVDGHEVRKLREARLWTQEELAEKSQVHPRTVQRVESRGSGSAQTIRRMAIALGVEAGSLEVRAPAGEPIVGRLQPPWIGVGAAFLWVALSSLLYVPTADIGLLASGVAAAGFASFAVGLWCLARGWRQRA